MVRCLIVLIALLGVACGNAPPKLSVTVTRNMAAPAISSYERLDIVFGLCSATSTPTVTEIQPSADPGQPALQIEPDIPPRTPFYVWLRGWNSCQGSCAPYATTHGDQCTCFDDRFPVVQQVLSADGCSDWLLLSASSNTKVGLTLNPHQSPGLCPPNPATCPKP
jgi:hypothetical protein